MQATQQPLTSLGATMNNKTMTTIGIKLLVKKCSDEFRRPEKMDNYALNGYKEAENKIIKLCTCDNSDH